MTGDEHAFDRKEVTGKEDKDELIAAIGQQSCSAGPSLEEPIDEAMLGIGLDEYLVGTQCKRASLEKGADLLFAAHQSVQKLWPMECKARGV